MVTKKLLSFKQAEVISLDFRKTVFWNRRNRWKTHFFFEIVPWSISNVIQISKKFNNRKPCKTSVFLVSNRLTWLFPEILFFVSRTTLSEVLRIKMIVMIFIKFWFRVLFPLSSQFRSLLSETWRLIQAPMRNILIFLIRFKGCLFVTHSFFFAERNFGTINKI